MSGFDPQRRRSIMSSSRNSSPSSVNHDISSELKAGARAQVQGKIGTIRFVGTTSFQTGKWVGIELDEAQGKNSGVVQGKRYFECRTNHGVFVRPSQVKVITPEDEQEEEDGEEQQNEESISPSLSERRFAPAQDPNLAAARTVQQHTPSSSSTLLPSRITSPSRISRLPNANGRKTNVAGLAANSRKSASPTASVTNAARKSKVATPSTTRPRSNTNTQKDVKENKLQQLRQQQQERLVQLQQQQLLQQQQQEEEDEEEAELHRQLQEEEELAARDQEEQDAYELQQQQQQQQEMSETESMSSMSDRGGVGMVSTTSSTALPQKQLQQQQPQQSYGSLAANLPVSKSDQMIPLKDYEELRLKLKILESKRQEDRERYREHEKVKEEAEQFLTLRNKLQDKISELQKELRDTKRQLKESCAEQETYENNYNDAVESLEMMTLDKEVAEERAEHLQQEVNILKDKIEEISVDLDVLKKEADIINRVPDHDGDEKTPLEVIQLERHNERLKEALMKLRDVAKVREDELSNRIKDLEKETYELEEVKGQYDKTRGRLEDAEYTIEELKQRLDDALGAEDLVEQLTEKNLALTEKMDEMRMVIDDLEALKELADELEENHMETEKQLQAEIDHRDMLLREQMERLRSCEETNADYEATIQQFRELVTTLQNDLEQLRHKEVSQQSEKQTLSSQSQAMMSLNMQLQSTVMKAQAKSIDLELRKLDAAQANDRLSYIQPYLPDSFFKTENDAISCVLLYKRLVFKAELIIKHLDQNHPISEKIMDTVPESLVAVCEMRQRAGWLSDLGKRFVTFIINCNPLTFIKMGQVYHDLVGTERRLTGIVDLLRTDEINETECVVELQRMIAQLEHLSEIHLVQSEANHVDQFFGLTRALDLNADRMTVELTYVKQAVDHAAQSDNINIIEGRERLDYDYLEPLGRLIVQAKNSKILAKKLLRQLEDLSEQALTLKSEYLHRFKMLYAISSKLSKFCYETYKQISAYVDAKVSSKEEISLGIIQQIVYNKADEILEIAESTMWEACLKTLKSLTNELGTTFERISNENKTEKIATGVAPWVQRASDMKAEVVMNHDMERKLQQHCDEIVKLIKDVKIKDQALQESSVKIELLEKRMETVKKQADQALEETLTKTQAQEKIYTEAVEKLQAEYDGLEQENIQLKKNAAKKEEKRLSAPKKAEFDMLEEASSTLETDSTNSHEVASQVESLKAAIRYLRAENAHLKGSDIIRSLHLQDEYKQKKPVEPQVQAMMRSFALETRMLVKDLRTASATPKVIQLSADRKGGKWQSEKRLPDYQYQTQQSVLYTLKQRCDQLKDKMDKVRKDQHQSQTSTSHINPTALIKSTENLKSLAKLKLPLNGTQSSNHNRCIQLNSLLEFEKIHSTFVR
ncbi:dynactin [Mucor ambiguus]|uniref:Dynactin n=1 Tax=Mucor ambiguus TaxID=91626 RepID=A0A0C9LYE6_9FUNG|nr:dynactin [Mucor ambiguus]